MKFSSKVGPNDFRMFDDVFWDIVRNFASLVQDDNPLCNRHHRFQNMLNQDDRDPCGMNLFHQRDPKNLIAGQSVPADPVQSPGNEIGMRFIRQSRT